MPDFSRASNPPVVMRFGAFGDMVMLLPMLRWLHRRSRAPVDLIASGGWIRPLLGMQDCVGEIRLLTSRKAPYLLNRSQREMVHWLKAQPPRPLILCETDEKSRDFARWAGRPAESVFWAGDDPFREGEHWVERWLRLAHECYGEAFDPAAVPALLRQGWVEVDADAGRDCAEWIERRGWAGRPLILIQAGSKRTMRRGNVDRASNVKFWPHESWERLAHALLDRHPEAVVLFCGSPQEAEYAEALATAVARPASVISVADNLPIPRLLALQQRALGMVSVDTGPAHAAAAMNCPLVVLFGDMPPWKWRPYAVDAPVEIVRAAEPVDVRSITLEQVLEAWHTAVPV